MNSNYMAGRKVEYERMKFWRGQGHTCWRGAGSHGVDLTTVSPEGNVQFISIKLTPNRATALRLIKQFRDQPSLGTRSNATYRQGIEVRVKGSKEVMSSWC